MSKYFLAILPPKHISNEIIEMQKEIAVEYSSTHSLNSPPHITIIPPFECDSDQLENCIMNLPAFFEEGKYSNLEIVLNNFQYFDFRALFIDVDKNDLLFELRREVKILFNKKGIIRGRAEKHDFLPHITIANKFIRKREFKRLWQDFKDKKYSSNFILKEMILLEFKEGKWIIYKSVL